MKLMISIAFTSTWFNRLDWMSYLRPYMQSPQCDITCFIQYFNLGCSRACGVISDSLIYKIFLRLVSPVKPIAQTCCPESFKKVLPVHMHSVVS